MGAQVPMVVTLERVAMPLSGNPKTNAEFFCFLSLSHEFRIMITPVIIFIVHVNLLLKPLNVYNTIHMSEVVPLHVRRTSSSACTCCVLTAWTPETQQLQTVIPHFVRVLNCKVHRPLVQFQYW